MNKQVGKHFAEIDGARIHRRQAHALKSCVLALRGKGAIESQHAGKGEGDPQQPGQQSQDSSRAGSKAKLNRNTTRRPKIHMEASVSRCRHSTRRSFTKMAEMTRKCSHEFPEEGKNKMNTW
jgi:hypothetical protein